MFIAIMPLNVNITSAITKEVQDMTLNFTDASFIFNTESNLSDFDIELEDYNYRLAYFYGLPRKSEIKSPKPLSSQCMD